MSAVKAAQYAISQLRPSPGETVESFAQRMYWRQMDVYSGIGGGDMGDWSQVTAEQKAEWYRAARTFEHALPEWKS